MSKISTASPAAVNTDIEKGKTEDGGESETPQVSQAVQRGQKKMQQTQAQIEEVTEIMRVNVEKVLNRDEMISQLDERADALKEGAEMFEKQAGALKSKYWWENMKMIAVMVGVALVFILVFFVWVSGN